jgi:hypothetical protein
MMFELGNQEAEKPQKFLSRKAANSVNLYAYLFQAHEKEPTLQLFPSNNRQDLSIAKRDSTEEMFAAIYSLQGSYIFRKSARINEFLLRNPFLVNLLKKAANHIKTYFRDVETYLEVVDSFDMPESNQLVASISTSLSPEEALGRLEQFDDKWWLDAVPQAQGKLCIKLEFHEV